VTSTGIDSRWQVDLIDFKQMEATKNNGYRLVLVVSDVFSRFVWAVPIKDKSQKAVAAAFKGIIDTGRKPAEVDSDGGAEFTGAFDALLEEKGIAHRTKNPKQINAIAVVDSAIKKLKDTIRQEMAEEGTGNWSKFIPNAAKAANNSSHDHLMGSRPADVKDNATLQYALKKEAGKDAKQNNSAHLDKIESVKDAGVFRVLLPASTWGRTMTPKYGNEVHTLANIVGAEAVDDKGNRYPLRDILPVSTGSRATTAPVDLSGQAKQGEQREQLLPFAVALYGMIGNGSLTLQGVSAKMRKIPNFLEFMKRVKVVGNGSLERFVKLFPDKFEIEGPGNRKTVKRKSTGASSSGASSSGATGSGSASSSGATGPVTQAASNRIDLNLTGTSDRYSNLGISGAPLKRLRMLQ